VYSLVDDAKVTSRRKLGLAAAVAAEAEEAQA
jgi:hypothetical protein